MRCLHHHQAAPHLMNGGRAAQPSPPTTMQLPVQWWPLVALLVLLACPCIIARNRFSKGPSIKYVSTFFTIFNTPFPMSALFYTYSSSIFPQSLTPPPEKMLTYFMDGPQEELLGRKEAYAALLSTTAPHCTAHKYVCVLGW